MKDDNNFKNQKEEKYYLASEVAKMQNISKQCVIYACKSGKYPGAYKTEPTTTGQDGVWQIPASLFNTCVEEVFSLQKNLTPNRMQQIISETVKTEIKLAQENYINYVDDIVTTKVDEIVSKKTEILQTELIEMRKLVEAHFKQVDNKLRNAIPTSEDKKSWFKRIWG